METQTYKCIINVTNELGFSQFETNFLDLLINIYETQLEKNHFLEHNLEFSFTTDTFPKKVFRYCVDTSNLSSKEIEKIIRLGLNSFENRFQKNNAISKVFDLMITNINRYPVLGVGVEHSLDGSISIFKIYNRSELSVSTFKILLPEVEREQIDNMIYSLQKIWPNWKSVNIVGLDYLSSGENRLKLYFPQNNCKIPLSLVDFCKYILDQKWIINTEIFPVISHLIIGRQSYIVPTAYMVGLAVGLIPSIKLVIVPKAYFKDNEEAFNAVLKVSEFLGLDTLQLYRNMDCVRKHNPFNRLPLIEEMALNFYPNGSNRIILYCKL